MTDEQEIKKSVYQAIRDQVVHEDNLTNQRFTWILSSNAFLLTGFFVLLSNNNRFETEPVLFIIFVSLICIAGFISCFFLKREINKNAMVYDSLRHHWYHRYSEEGKSKDNNKPEGYPDKVYPDIHHTSPKIKFDKSIHIVSNMLMLVWITLLILNFLMVWMFDQNIVKKVENSHPLIRKSSYGSDSTVFTDTIYVP